MVWTLHSKVHICSIRFRWEHFWETGVVCFLSGWPLLVLANFVMLPFSIVLSSTLGMWELCIFFAWWINKNQMNCKAPRLGERWCFGICLDAGLTDSQQVEKVFEEWSKLKLVNFKSGLEWGGEISNCTLIYIWLEDVEHICKVSSCKTASALEIELRIL